jgi:hypothetical protein
MGGAVRYRVETEPETISVALQSAERQLWCAVLDRAFDDAMDRVGAVSGPRERTRLCHEARQWFALNGLEFRIACEGAGFDPDHLRSRILAMVAPAKV